jgi:hypothetical protein
MLSYYPNRQQREMFDGTDLDQWMEMQVVQMVYNRLVLFDSRLFHAPLCYFGDSMEDCRLIQHFRFEQLTDAALLTRWRSESR